MQDVDRSSFNRIETVRRLLPKGPAKSASVRSSSSKKAPANPRRKKAGRVHIIGVCGTGMTAVLQLLKHYQFEVSGSDKAFYPPMGEIVRKTADRVFEGYAADHLDSDLDLVVVGNSVSADNPEVRAMTELNLPFASMPEVFAALLIGDKDHCATSIVAAGTHGKTTTSSAAAWLLESAGLEPGYFIGGAPRDLPSGMRPVSESIQPDKRCVVLEGDEYDSAFFAKWPKFHSYRPDIVIITSLEFDHGDIYKSIEEIEEEFTKLVRRMPAGGSVLVCDQWPRLIRLGESWSADPAVAASIVHYGNEINSPFRIKLRVALADRAAQSTGIEIPAGGEPAAEVETSAERTSPGQQLVFELNGAECRTVSPLTGGHNALNLCGAAAAASIAGLSAEQIAAGIATFHGVLRRQTIKFDRRGITVIEDFAHHPTAIDLTLRALRESYPDRRLIAVYEPRSATGRRGYFQEQYPDSFDPADLVLIQEVADAGQYSGTGDPIVALDVKRIISELESRGKSGMAFAGAAEIERFLSGEIRSGDLVVIMTNGDFGGMIPRLIGELDRRFGIE